MSAAIEAVPDQAMIGTGCGAEVPIRRTLLPPFDDDLRVVPVRVTGRSNEVAADLPTVPATDQSAGAEAGVAVAAPPQGDEAEAAVIIITASRALKAVAVTLSTE